ncbi:hypothetical protein NKG05_17210 [Oerskovia sp. M15]
MNKTRSVGISGRSRGRRFAMALTAATLAVTVATGCSDAAHEEDRQVPADQTEAAAIEWGPCPEAAAGVVRDSRLTCATVEVPLNYDEPDGTSIEVAISRLATADPTKRHGVLLLNPGGPALSGLDLPSTMAPTLPKSVLDGYDLIGFDPRGVEHSTPQSCGLEIPSVPGHFPIPPRTARSTRTSSWLAPRPRGAPPRPGRTCGTSTPPTPLVTWTASARRSASRRSPTGASPTAPTWVPSTARCTRSTPTA